MLLHSQHYSDRAHATNPRLQTRKISNWLNKWSPDHGKGNGRDPGDSQEWQPSQRGIIAREANVPNWDGPNEFGHQSRRGPLEMFFRDASDVNNRSTYGVRRSDLPGIWVNFKALDCTASDAVVSEDGLTVTHQELWPATDVVLTDGGHKLKEDLILDGTRKAEWPERFGWTVKVAPGCTLEVANDVLRVRDSDGVVRIETRAPWGHDSTTTAPTIDGKQYIRCTFTEEGTAYGLPVVWLTPNADDMAQAVGDVTLDPTTVISGTTDIKDNLLLHLTSGGSHRLNNYGANAAAYLAGGRINNANYGGLLWFNEASIPSGSITALRWTFYRWGFGGVNGITLRASPIVDGAVGWDAGTAWGTQVPGTSCLSYQSFDFTTPTLWEPGAAWANDDASTRTSDKSTKAFGAYSSGPPLASTWSLDPNWAEQWRSGGGWNNSGFSIRDDAYDMHATAPTNDTFVGIFQSENTSPGSVPMTFEIDSAAAGNPRYYYDMLARRRRS